jgi:4a-hydroxytetrahydrobiopterin dehydratase
MSLDKKQCVPCQGGIPPLTSEEQSKLLRELDESWKINSQGHLEKAYAFSDFVSAMAFANRLTELAEAQAHHPDLHISWGSCRVEIWTHKISGLTESDFILAAKIDALN